MSTYADQVDTCTGCGECNLACHVCAVNDTEMFTPENKIKILGKIETNEPLTQGELDSIYLCTRCGACNDMCPMDIDIAGIVQHCRSLLAKQGREPEKTTHIARNIMTKYNPQGLEEEDRCALWVTDDLRLSDESSTAYMAGCWVAFKNVQIAQDTVRLLNACDVTPRIVPEERCCGLFLIDNGHLDEAREYAREYTEYLESLGFEQLLVSCPGCYNVLNNIYPELYRAPKYKIVQTIEYFKELHDRGILELGNAGRTVMIKDTCHMKEQFDNARALLKAAGYEILDPFEKSRFCCGAPAGMKPNYPEISNAVGKYSLDRIGDAECVATYCPFCMHHFDGVREAYDMKVSIEDIASLLLHSMDPRPSE